MKPKQELAGVVGFSFIVGLAAAFLTQQSVFAPQQFLETTIAMRVFFSTVNAMLLAGLIYNYTQIYRNMPTSTAKILLGFSAALLFNAVASNPLVHLIFGYEILSIGPFTYLPDLFITVATLAILYESYK